MTPDDLNRAAQALYEAGQSVRPSWDQTGDTTRSVWRERAQRVIGHPAAFPAEYMAICRAASQAFAAPAVCVGQDPTCPCRDGLACHYRDAADGTKAFPLINGMVGRVDSLRIIPSKPALAEFTLGAPAPKKINWGSK